MIKYFGSGADLKASYSNNVKDFEQARSDQWNNTWYAPKSALK